jgi:hypothetical protein
MRRHVLKLLIRAALSELKTGRIAARPADGTGTNGEAGQLARYTEPRAETLGAAAAARAEQVRKRGVEVEVLALGA